MDKKQRKQLEIDLKRILYYIEDKNEQDKMIKLLEKYNAQFPDSKLKDLIDKWAVKLKNNYFDIVDYLIKDLFDGKMTEAKKKAINNMLKEIQPSVEKAQKSFWDKLVGLFSWS